MIKTLLSYCLILSAAWGMEPLLTTSQVAASLNDPKVKLIDVSEDDVYNKQGHLHGAVHTKISEWRRSNDKHLLINTPEEIQKLMRRLGIDNDSKVIIYSHLETPKDLLTSSYLFWAMRLHGLKEVALMDGGMKKWTQEKRFVLQEESKVAEGNFTAVLNPLMAADLSYVRQGIGKKPMIDARPSEYYFGMASSDGVERSGHIPGAMSYFWMYSVTPELMVKPVNELKSIFAEGFALRPEQEIILYCTGGLETSFNYFVLNALLGYKNIRLYDASMREWGNRADTPMVRYKWEMFQTPIEVIP